MLTEGNFDSLERDWLLPYGNLGFLEKDGIDAKRSSAALNPRVRDCFDGVIQFLENWKLNSSLTTSP